MNIVLIGYRGSGKTAIGKRLAVRFNMDFVDTDVLIVERAGKTIREIFAAEGEDGFRRRESDAIRQIAARDNQVIALGAVPSSNLRTSRRSGTTATRKSSG